MANKITVAVKSFVKASVAALSTWRFGAATAASSGIGTAQNARWMGDNINRGPGVVAAGQKINYQAKVGEYWKNNSVATGLNWIKRNFPDARIGVTTTDDEAVDLSHPMALLLARPNPHYSYSTLCAGLTFSYVAAGDAYLLKVRNGYGQVVELYWRPHWMLKPVREPGSDNYIDYYLYKPDAKTPEKRLAPRDVVHLRNGINPENELCGMSDLMRLLLTVYTEQEANRFLASVLANLGLPGAIFVHKPPVLDEESGELGHITEEMATKVKNQYEENFTGENVGRAMVLDGEYDVKFPSISIDAALLEKAKDISQADIAAAIGIPAVVLGWNVGLKTATAKASHEDSRKQAYRECLMPMQRAMAEDMDIQLLPDFADNKKFRTAFDYRRVATLSEDQTAITQRASTLYAGGIAMLSEARKMVGLKSGPEHDTFAPRIAPKDPNETDPTKPAKNLPGQVPDKDKTNEQE